MSSVTSFKQKCPSCGGLITIKNPELVGKKVDCPKCKFRFVVENPDGSAPEGDEERDTASAPTPERTKKSKKSGPARVKGKGRVRSLDDDDKKGSNKGLLIMAGVGVAVLVGVGLILAFAFGVFSGEEKKPQPAPQAARKPEPPKEEADPGAKLRDHLAKNEKKDALELLTNDNQETADKAQAAFDEELAKNASDHGSADSYIDSLFSGQDGGRIAKLKAALDSKLVARFGPRDLADEPTNMLPKDTQTALSLAVNRFINGTFGNAVFGRGAFKTTDFDTKLGISLETMGQIVIGANKDHNQVLVIVRTTSPYDQEAVKRALQISGSKKTQKGRDYWTGKVDFLVDFLDNRFPLAGLKSQAAVLFKNPRTLVYGDEGTVQKYLDEPPPFNVAGPPPAAGGAAPPQSGLPAGGYPGRPAGGGPPSINDGGPPLGSAGAGAGGGGPPLGSAGAGAGGGGPPIGSAGAGAGGGGPPLGSAGAGAGGAATVPPIGGFGGGPPGGAAPAPPPTEKYWLTIDKSLRKLIEVTTQKKQPVLVFADASKKPMPATTFYYFGQLSAAQQRVIEAMAMSLHTEDKLVLRLAALCKEKKDSDSIKKDLHKLLTTAAKGELRDMLGFEFHVTDAGDVAQSSGFGGGFGRGGYPGFPGGGRGDGLGEASSGAGGSLTLPGGAGGAPAGPAGGGGGIALPGGGGGLGKGGGAGGAASGIDASGGGGAAGGFGPFAPGRGQPEIPDDASTIELGRQEEIVTLVVTVQDKSAETFIDDKLGPRAADIRAAADMRSGRVRIGELAGGMRPLLSNKGDTFPQGALPRRADPNRGLRAWPASERVSWLRDLLPYLDSQYLELYQGINPDKSWKDADNVKSGRYLIPQFVDARSGNYFTKVRGVNQRMAVTHFVGMAGVGPDAPFYAKNDPRAGIFGYDRATTLADIKDGLSHTIYMIQTDSSLAGPWVAGGGATVRGTSEKGDDVGRRGGFLAPSHGGKAGTWVIMADGSTRFLTKDVDSAVFKALCTMAGDEPKPDLNSIAPESKFGGSAAPAPAAAAPKKAEPAKKAGPKEELEEPAKKTPEKKD